MNPKHPAGPPMTLGNMRATGLETRSSNEQRVVRSSILAAEAVKGRHPCPERVCDTFGNCRWQQVCR